MSQADLIVPTPSKPGRRRNVTARAWIARPKKKQPFQSHVSLGDGVVHTLATKTHDREKALAFNLTHLLARLNKKNPAPARKEHQQEMEGI